MGGTISAPRREPRRHRDRRDHLARSLRRRPRCVTQRADCNRGTPPEIAPVWVTARSRAKTSPSKKTAFLRGPHSALLSFCFTAIARTFCGLPLATVGGELTLNAQSPMRKESLVVFTAASLRSSESGRPSATRHMSPGSRLTRSLLTEEMTRQSWRRPCCREWRRIGFNCPLTPILPSGQLRKRGSSATGGKRASTPEARPAWATAKCQ